MTLKPATKGVPSFILRSRILTQLSARLALDSLPAPWDQGRVVGRGLRLEQWQKDHGQDNREQRGENNFAIKRPQLFLINFQINSSGET
jgi:hypothetical protein